jgi:aromatic-L-amino-acid/L-tryptophan decarboxylase
MENINMKLLAFDVLTFDCYGTLIDWETGIINALQGWLQRHNRVVSDAEILTVFTNYETRQQQRTPHKRYPEILAHVHHKLATHWGLEATPEETQTFATSIKDWPVFDDSIITLRYLQKFFKLVILSNVDHQSFMASQQKLDIEFDKVITAEDVGCYKPNRANFDYLLTTLAAEGIPGEKICHVAQSLYHDHVPAEQLGIHSCWIDRRHKQEGWGATPAPQHAVTPALTVQSLADLAQHLAQELHSQHPQSGNKVSLDPSNWKHLEEQGVTMVKDMLGFIERSGSGEQAAWQPVPKQIKAQFTAPLPQQASSVEDVYSTFKNTILPYPTGNLHPRFWGWVLGNGSAYAMLAEMLAAGMNSHMGGFEQSSSLVEEQVLHWLREMMHFPASSSGLLMNGASMANTYGVTVALNKHTNFKSRQAGLHQLAIQLVLYTSSETHHWAQKAVELLGLGAQALRKIPVDEHYRMDCDLLQAAIRSDRSQGLQPFCVIATAGTVNTGATDDLERIAKICQAEKLWFHIDGAFGLLAAITKYRPLIKGYEHADSIAFDLHKWMYMPFTSACVLIKDAKAHQNTFTVPANYLNSVSAGMVTKPLKFANLGIELTRRFSALKVWMSLKIHGLNTFTQLIEKNIEQAHYLAQRVKQDHNLELLAPAPLNVVCFRYLSHAVADLDHFNKLLMVNIQESGEAVLSSTVIKNQFALRVAITNHRTELHDIDIFLTVLLRIAQNMEAPLKSPPPPTVSQPSTLFTTPTPGARADTSLSDYPVNIQAKL